MLTTIRVIILFIFIASLNLSFATTEKDNQQSLNRITKNLSRWKAYITDHEKKQVRLQTKLKSQEQQIGETNKQLHDINQQILRQKKTLTRLEQEQILTRTQMTEQQTEFGEQLRDTFLLSQPNTLKILLSQTDPAKIGRQLTLYRYLLEKKVTLLAHLEDNLFTLASTKKDMQAVNIELEKLRKHAQKAKQHLHTEQTERHKLLRQLKQEIRTGHAKVSQLQHEKQALEQLIANLQPHDTGIDMGTMIVPRNRQSLNQFKHRLSWPIKGHIAHRYGESIDTSDLKWQGLFIATSEGKPVHAIYPGRVVFADWLQGFGFMLILDHDDGFMSLYARNQSLIKHEGDRVRSQEVIATSGKSGGFSKSGLYFELRRKGKPLDPLDWLKKN